MAALDSLDSLTDADRQHLAPFLHVGATSARSTALQYVKSVPVSKKEPQGRRILAASVCVKNPDAATDPTSSTERHRHHMANQSRHCIEPRRRATHD